MSDNIPDFKSNVTLQKYTQIQAFVNSKLFDIEVEDSYMKFLLPFFDAIQHQNVSSATISYDQQKGGILIKAEEDVIKG